MASKFIYFIGKIHHRTYTKPYQNILPGKEVFINCPYVNFEDLPEEIFEEDSSDTIWLFPDIFIGLHDLSLIHI